MGSIAETFRWSHRLTLGAALAVAAALCGCLERKERITIESDGSSSVLLEYSTDDERELTDGDAMPSERGGWEVERASERKQDGGTRFTLRAQRRFASDERMPRSMALAGDADQELALQSETDIWIEDRGDEVVCHFRRLYPKREWAEIAAMQKEHIDDRLAAIREKPASELTMEDRAEILRAITAFEIAKIRHFGRLAFLESTPEGPQDGWLAVSAALEELEASRNVEPLIDVMFSEEAEDSKKQKAWETAQKRFERDVIDTFESMLRERCYYGARKARLCTQALERQLREYRITEGLGDDSFEVEVRLPGTVVGTNAGTQAGDSVTFRFRGTDLRDRDIELLASSRLR